MKLLKTLVLVIFVSKAMIFASLFSLETPEPEISEITAVKNPPKTALFLIFDNTCESFDHIKQDKFFMISVVYQEENLLFFFSWAKDNSKCSCWGITHLSTEVEKLVFSHTLTGIGPTMIEESKCTGLTIDEGMNNSHRNLGSGNLVKLEAEASTVSAITTTNQTEVPGQKLSIMLPSDYPIEESRSRSSSWDDWYLKSLPGSPIPGSPIAVY